MIHKGENKIGEVFYIMQIISDQAKTVTSIFLQVSYLNSGVYILKR